MKKSVTKIGTLGFTAFLVTASLLASPAYAGDLDCKNETTISSSIACHAISGTIFVLGAGVIVVSKAKDLLTPSIELDARINDSSEIISIKLTGLNHTNYKSEPFGREKPLRLRCERIEDTKINRENAPPHVKSWPYGYCKEERPAFVAKHKDDKNPGAFYTYLAYNPMVSFEVGKDGVLNPHDAETKTILNIRIWPVRVAPGQ